MAYIHQQEPGGGAVVIPVWVIFGACFAGSGAAIMLWLRFKRRRAVAT